MSTRNVGKPRKLNNSKSKSKLRIRKLKRPQRQKLLFHKLNQHLGWVRFRVWLANLRCKQWAREQKRSSWKISANKKRRSRCLKRESWKLSKTTSWKRNVRKKKNARNWSSRKNKILRMQNTLKSNRRQLLKRSESPVQGLVEQSTSPLTLNLASRQSKCISLAKLPKLLWNLKRPKSLKKWRMQRNLRMRSLPKRKQRRKPSERLKSKRMKKARFKLKNTDLSNRKKTCRKNSKWKWKSNKPIPSRNKSQ